MKPVHVCRCCLSKNCFKDVSSEYFYGERKEVYSEMLFDTFNVNISYIEDSKRLICEECIVKLRDAYEFRNQIIQCEENFARRIFTLQDTKSLKVEFDYRDEFLDHITGEYQDDYDDQCSGDDTGWQCDEVMISDEDFTKGDLYSMKLNSNIESINHKEIPNSIPTQTTQEQNEIIATEEQRNEPEFDDEIDFDDEVKITVMKKQATKVKRKPKIDTDTGKKKKICRKNPQPPSQLKLNSIKLIENSNLCLFDSLKTRFKCFFCKENYFKMAELRDHITSHENTNHIVKVYISRLKGMTFKNADISNLKCKLCEQDVKDLYVLRSHLTDVHQIDFYDGEHMIIPYKLLEGFRCVVCDETFNSYFRLAVHMNKHYQNHVCEVCGVSYINRMSLRLHVSSVHKEKKCSKCSLTFLSNYSRIKHMRKVHNTCLTKRYCLICNTTFRYTYLLKEHMVMQHGAKREVCNCSECGKVFYSAANLRVHVRSVHLKERNYPCEFCSMSFFTKCDQRRHERTHIDIRSFACGCCQGKFKSKDSLRRHLKRQHGHLFIPGLEESLE